MRTAAVDMRGAKTEPLGRARLNTAALFGDTQGKVCCIMGTDIELRGGVTSVKSLKKAL
jgi:hypothetical protein